MNAAGVIYQDIANGIGIRTSLFVSGCRRHCKGCHNEKMWDFGYGVPFTPALQEEIIRSLEPEWVSGLSVLGGEPFEAENEKELVPFLRSVRERLPGKDIWIYSGYTLEELESQGHEMLGLCDVLVDGPYVENLRNISLPFRGSENQRIHCLRRKEE